MSLQKLKDQKGFTIVELLIVIVVIGILAAISIVAYAGVTKKANASAAKGNAEAVQKVAEAYNADNSSGYPTDAATLKGFTTGTSRIPSGVSLTNGTATAGTGVAAGVPEDSNGKTTIGYTPLTSASDGGCVSYWDFEASGTNKLKFVYVGAAKTGAVTGAGASGVVTCS